MRLTFVRIVILLSLTTPVVECQVSLALLREHVGGAANVQLGRNVVPVEDLDGDGVVDYLLMARGDGNSSGNISGFVSVVSAYGGDVIATWTPNPGSTVESMASIDDVNLDGVSEIAIGVGGFGVMPTVELRSLFGSLLWFATGGVMFGNQVESCGDFNSDGFVDVLTYDSQQVFVLSGLNGLVLFSKWARGVADICGLGDVNGDGVDDFAYVREFGNDRALLVISGGAGVEITSRNFSAGGLRVSRIGDVDGDALSDVVVSSAAGATLSGEVYVLSGFDAGQVISQATGAPGSAFGWQVVSVSDQDGDGYRDYLASGSAGCGVNGASSICRGLFKCNRIHFVFSAGHPWNLTIRVGSRGSR